MTRYWSVMATATMATAAGAAALLYYTLNKKLDSDRPSLEDDENASDFNSNVPLGIERVSHRFTYSETLGKWPIGDLAFGISFLLKRQGNLHVERVFGGKDSIRLKGPEIVAELKDLLNLLTLCWHFSKKPFPLFLEETGYSSEDVLIQEPKAGILKPAFTILVDHKTKYFLLLIRGTHSIKDTLTAATGAVVPFHHTVVDEGGVSYAHCGMVAAARWIAKLATPCLLEALSKYCDYKVKIVGHSLGGGTAALLTYILREQKELSTTSCVTFAPGACMTRELAESGTNFIVAIINGADLVPTFSAASVDDLRAEVTASAWVNDLRNQIEQTRILSTVYRSASALGSRLPSMATARQKVAGAGAVLRPVSNGTQAVMRRAQSMAHAAWTGGPSLRISSWSCIGPRRRVVNNLSGEDGGDSPITPIETQPLASSAMDIEMDASVVADGEELIDRHAGGDDHLTEVEMWHQLEHELYDDEEADADVEEIRKEEAEAVAEVAGDAHTDDVSTSEHEVKEVHRFFPAGRIMHVITLHESDDELEDIHGNTETTPDEAAVSDTEVGIFLTPRTLYSRLRLSKRMISDHFMPVYRRQIEKVIADLEKEREL
ncbi:hypothetical protein V2J09_023427 [Rumex salicifolius]